MSFSAALVSERFSKCCFISFFSTLITRACCAPTVRSTANEYQCKILPADIFSHKIFVILLLLLKTHNIRILVAASVGFTTQSEFCFTALPV